MLRKGLAAASVVLPLLQNPASIVPRYFDGLNWLAGEPAAHDRRISFEGRGLETHFSYRFSCWTKGGDHRHPREATRCPHSQLLAELSRAMSAFNATMEALGIGAGVTTSSC